MIKVLDYERTVKDGQKSCQINRLSIISQDPGHRFGNPANYFDVFDECDEDEVPAIIQSSDTPIENQIYHKLTHQSSESAVSSRKSQTLSELYSCQYPSSEKPVDSKIPNIGWEIDTHGVAPGPRCRWIPPPPIEQEKSLKPNVTTSAISGSL